LTDAQSACTIYGYIFNNFGFLPVLRETVHDQQLVRMNLANRFLQDSALRFIPAALTFPWGRFEVYPSALISGVIGRGYV
jgi:hypothetical protein